jgi:hypothetical protein
MSVRSAAKDGALHHPIGAFGRAPTNTAADDLLLVRIKEHAVSDLLGRRYERNN